MANDARRSVTGDAHRTSDAAAAAPPGGNWPHGIVCPDGKAWKTEPESRNATAAVTTSRRIAILRCRGRCSGHGGVRELHRRDGASRDTPRGDQVTAFASPVAVHRLGVTDGTGEATIPGSVDLHDRDGSASTGLPWRKGPLEGCHRGSTARVTARRVRWSSDGSRACGRSMPSSSCRTRAAVSGLEPTAATRLRPIARVRSAPTER